MRRRATYEGESRLLDCEGLAAYLSIGKSAAAIFGKKAGAERRFGRSVRYDVAIIDAAIDRMREENSLDL